MWPGWRGCARAAVSSEQLVVSSQQPEVAWLTPSFDHASDTACTQHMPALLPPSFDHTSDTACTQYMPALLLHSHADKDSTRARHATPYHGRRSFFQSIRDPEHVCQVNLLCPRFLCCVTTSAGIFLLLAAYQERQQNERLCVVHFGRRRWSFKLLRAVLVFCSCPHA